jgi:murein L,D-transpeptidase YafK
MMRFLLIFFSLIVLGFKGDGSFKKQQLQYPNVRTAYKEKWNLVKSKLAKAGIDSSHFEIFIRIFKKEAKLEVWGRSKANSHFKLVDSYAICSSSGDLGPKRVEGDLQVPEGFYQVKLFQPNSEFFLALGVSYPNQSDLIKGNKTSPGGDIMIHGNCVTIGCMPLTDDIIKEVYIMATEARNDGQMSIPIHIFPTRMTPEGIAWLKANYKDEDKLSFWENIEPGFTYFENKKILPIVTTNKKGDYIIQ